MNWYWIALVVVTNIITWSLCCWQFRRELIQMKLYPYYMAIGTENIRSLRIMADIGKEYEAEFRRLCGLCVDAGDIVKVHDDETTVEPSSSRD